MIKLAEEIARLKGLNKTSNSDDIPVVDNYQELKELQLKPGDYYIMNGKKKMVIL